MDLVTWCLVFLINVLPVTSPEASNNCVLLAEGDTFYVYSPSGEQTDWYFIEPVKNSYDNMIPGGEPMGMGVDTLLYRVYHLCSGESELCLVLDSCSVLPVPGVFYLMVDPPVELLPDSFFCVEPLHLRYPEYVIQVVSRSSDDYLGYLFEMINTPFLMTPRLTPSGNQQADCRLGCDCAGLAVYGARRMGLNIPYAGPSGILEYLEPVVPGEFLPDSSSSPVVYRSGGGEIVPVGSGGIVPGDIVHFGAQVSVFLEDRGAPGVLDPDDMLIQSWFDGPHVCTVSESGFYRLPVKLFRWILPE